MAITLTASQQSAKNTALAALQAELDKMPASRTMPESVKKSKQYVKAAEAVGDTNTETYKKHKKAVDSWKPSGTSEVRNQFVWAVRMAKRIGLEPGSTLSEAEGH